MKFYGMPDSLIEWKTIIETVLNKPCSYLKEDDDDGRAYFETDLTKEDRDVLQKDYWYRREDNAPLQINGKPMPWNWRITFLG